MRKRLITPPPSDLKEVPTHILIMMAANQSGLLSPAGKRNIAAEIKLRNKQENRA